MAQTAAPKVPEWPSYGNFCKVTQNPHFLKKCKWGTKGNFSKIPQKVDFVLEAHKHSRANGIILLLKCTKTAKTGKHFVCAKGGPREIFQKSPKKMPSLKRPTSTLAQMALSSNYYVLNMQRLEKILGQKAASKSARMAKLWKFSQGHPKPAFSQKVQRGDQGKFFKNRLKEDLV